MASEPIMLFAPVPAAAAVVEALRRTSVALEVTGPDADWREIVATTGGWLRKRRLFLSNDPSYYSGERWTMQMAGLRGYLGGFPDSRSRNLAIALTHQFGFALGTTLAPDAGSVDARLGWLSAVAEAIEAVWVSPSSFRDARGRVLYCPDLTLIDARAQWPAYASALPA
jgi:hypothetical protein